MSHSHLNNPSAEKGRGRGDNITDAWQHHEHISAQMELDALRLLADAGTPELAKFAIDSVEEQQRDRARAEFAQAHGFSSYGDLLAASSGVATRGDQLWFITMLTNGEWIGWNILDVQVCVKHPTREDAIRYIAECVEKAERPQT